MTRRKRFLLITAALVVAGLVSVPILRPFVLRAAADKARRQVIARAAEGLGAPISVGGVDVSLMPTVIVLSDLRLDRDGAFGLQAGSSLKRLTLSGDPRALARWGSRPVRIDVEHPDCRLVLPGGARTAATPDASVAARDGDDRHVAAFPAGSTLTVRDGQIRAEAPNGLSFGCEGFGLDTGPATPPAQLQGHITCARGVVRSPFGNLEGIEGQTGFAWGDGTLRLEPLILHGDGLDLSASGTLHPDAAAPAMAGKGALGFDLVRAAPWLPAEALPSGRIDLRIDGGYSGGRMQGQGDLRSSSMSLYGLDIKDLSARLSLAETVGLRDLKADLLGGRVTGGADLGLPHGGAWSLSADLVADRLDAARLLALASWSGPPITGVVSYRGRHAINQRGLASLSGGGDLSIAARFRTPRGDLRPFEARCATTTTGRSLALADGTVKMEGVEGRFDGLVTPADGLSLRLHGAAGRLGDLLPLFRLASPGGAAPAAPAAAPAKASAPPAKPSAAPQRDAPGGRAAAASSIEDAPSFPIRLLAWGPPPPDPLQALTDALGGRWEWDGDLRFDAGGMRFEGRITGKDLTWRGAPIGALTAEVRYAGERIDIRSLHLDATGGGSVSLQGGVDFRAPGALRLEGEFDEVRLPLLTALAGVAIPIEGTVGGRVKIGGTPGAPEGSATIATGPLRVSGVPLDGLHGELQLKDGLLTARELVATRGAGVVRVDGTLAIDAAAAQAAEPAPAVSLEAHDLDLALFGPWPGGVTVAGFVGASGRLQGSFKEPVGRLGIRFSGVRIGNVVPGDMTLDLDFEPGGVRVTGAAPARTLALTGRVGLEPGLPLDLVLEAGDFTLTGPELMQGIPEDVSLALAGRATITGPAVRPREIAAQITLDKARVAVAGASATAEGQVSAALHDGRFTLEPAVLTGSGTRIDLRAGFDVDPDGQIDLQAHGGFDLALLRTFVRGLQAEGEGAIELQIKGLRRDPAFSGTMTMRAPRLRYPDLPFPVNDLDARVAFDGISARIETLTCDAGGGHVVADGQLLLGTSGVSRGLAAILAADVAIHGRDVSAELPAGFRSMSDSDLRLIYDPTGVEVSGTVNLVRGVYSRNFRIESSLLSGKAPAVFDLRPPTGPIADVRLNLSLQAPDQIWLRNDFGRIEGEVDLRVAGTASRPEVLGRVTALDGSTIDFNHVRYQVLSGTIDFSDPGALNPIFNLNAETTVGDYEVGLLVEGTVDRLRYELTSNPPLQQSDIVSLLLTGRPIGTFGSSSSTVSPENVSAYLAGQLGQELSSRFLGKVAPDVIAIDPLDTATPGDPSTRITVGKQITPDLRLTYTDVLGTNQGTAYQVDYRLGRNISFASEHSSTGSIGGDFRYILEGKPPLLPGDVASGLALPAPVVATARVEGVPVLAPEKVLKRLHLEPGQKRNRAKLNERVDKLVDHYHRKGYLMAEVDVRELPASQAGSIDVVVRAEAGPRVRLEIAGTSGAGALREQIAPLWQQTIFLEDTLEDSRARIATLVQDRGWRRAKVDARIDRNEPTLIEVRFDVDRGPRAKVAAVHLEGTHQITREEAFHVIKTRPDGPFRRGVVRADRLDSDAAALRALYVSRGFERADIDIPKVDLDETGKRATVTFSLTEGPRLSVRHTLFEGARGIPEEQLRTAAGLTEGVPFTREAAETAATRIRRVYDGSGWPDARIRWRATKAGGDDEAEEDDMIFTVEEGVRQSIDDVSISGNVLTDDNTIRRQLTVLPHESLSRVDLLASQSRLYRLGVFRSVDLRPVPLPKPAAPSPASPPAPAEAAAAEAAAAAPAPVVAPAAAEPAPPMPISAPATETIPPPAPPAPPAAPAAAEAAPPPAPGPSPGEPPAEPLPRSVEITVREAPSLRQSFGLGYDSSEKIRGLYEIAERNLFGSARYLGLQLRASSLEERASILYREQGIWSGRYDLTGSAYGIDEDRPAFTGRTVGITAQLGRDLGKATRLRYRYTLKDVNPTDDTDTLESGSTIRLASLSASGVHDTRDVPFGPARGHFYAIDVFGYGRAIGSEAQFAKLFLQAFTFKEILPRTVWAQAVRAGAAVTFGLSHSDPASTGDDLSGVPQTERFFAGGDTTLRGFRLDLAGPLDANGDPLGGEGLFLLNEELRFPIWSHFQGVIFADVGNVYRTLGDYSLRDLRECAGAGLRLMTPIGPFRMEYGALLDRRPGEEPGQFFISIGQAF